MNYGFCIRTCRDEKKSTTAAGGQAVKKQCKHRRRKNQCRDCSTGYCQHGPQKSRCKDCGTGYCKHRRRKGRCKDCGTGFCKHRRQAPEGPVQGLRHGLLLPARAPKEPVQGLRHGHPQARAPRGGCSSQLSDPPFRALCDTDTGRGCALFFFF
jgi:hypothetical protein